MKKRLLCLALCALMLISVVAFSGCSSSGDDNPDIPEQASRSTTTLNMMVMTEEGTDPEQAAAVVAAINKITMSKFKTKVNISFYTEDEYYAALEKSFSDKEVEVKLAEQADKALRKYKKEAKAYAKENGLQYKEADAIEKFYEEHPEYLKYAETTTDPTAETTAEETVYNEDTGLLELKYPEADPNVIDIFFIDGYDRLKEYIDKEWVARVDDALNAESKKLKDYISDVFLNSIKIDNGTYAIPNNRAVGEYTYMLLNKELLAKYFYNANAMPTLADCSEFLSDMVRFEPDVIPIHGAPELYNVLYWDIDPETLDINTNNFSIIGTTYNTSSTLGTQLQFTSLFPSKKAFSKQLLTNKQYEELGYFHAEVAEDAKCAIKIVHGGAELEKVYGEEYEMVVLESPCADTKTLFDSMFAVGGYSDHVTRSMEIITYINTNAELRNLLQYGIENVNYTLDANGQVVYDVDNKYWMDINKTGNSFIAHTLAGTDPEIWQYGMKQNRDATVDMILGFSLKEDADKIDTALIKKMQTLSAQVETRLAACQTYAELEALVNTLNDELNGRNNADIKRYVNMIAEEDASGKTTPYVLLYDWMLSMGFITEE